MVAAERSAQIEVNSMIQKGIRIAKPDLMISSFYGQPSNNTINVNISGTEGERIKYAVTNLTPEDIYSTWNAPWSTGARRGNIKEAVKKQIS